MNPSNGSSPVRRGQPFNPLRLSACRWLGDVAHEVNIPVSHQGGRGEDHIRDHRPDCLVYVRGRGRFGGPTFPLRSAVILTGRYRPWRLSWRKARSKEASLIKVRPVSVNKQNNMGVGNDPWMH